MPYFGFLGFEATALPAIALAIAATTATATTATTIIAAAAATTTTATTTTTVLRRCRSSLYCTLLIFLVWGKEMPKSLLPVAFPLDRRQTLVCVLVCCLTHYIAVQPSVCLSVLALRTHCNQHNQHTQLTIQPTFTFNTNLTF